jgi:hypothetical protein
MTASPKQPITCVVFDLGGVLIERRSPSLPGSTRSGGP